MHVNVRPAAVSDAAFLLALCGELDETHRREHPDLFPPTIVRERESLERKLLDPRAAYFVAELVANGEASVAGFVRVVDVQTPDGGVLLPRRYALVDELVVAPAFRRTGVASRLLDSAERWAARRGIFALEVAVWAFNRAAHALYEKQGYAPFRTYYRKSMPAAAAVSTDAASVSAPSVTLRELERADLGPIAAWRNDPDVARYLARLSMTSEQLTTWFDSLRRDAGERAFGIVTGDTLAGYATITGVDRENEKCELGVIIGDKTKWHRGIGSAVARSLAAIAFTELGLHRALAVASARNLASIRCFQKAGFREEGRLRHANHWEGEYIDLVLLSLLEPEWRR